MFARSNFRQQQNLLGKRTKIGFITMQSILDDQLHNLFSLPKQRLFTPQKIKQQSSFLRPSTGSYVSKLRNSLLSETLPDTDF
ncbi:hypothetical protein SS50377_27026 [Spironucleus salmonicida]|uniref:Uncharacterized protein n=1 Tax=Spironucleus salmonicida TaxID=348837 RepID=V6LV07_9EUKA|nr:hypothetical protein SS50377_27026 [Spironucleus salmonicida]|eukprot:EST47536.1 Hypothetical protein SS50377_12520 [Spironucleus salmonicida]